MLWQWSINRVASATLLLLLVQADTSHSMCCCTVASFDLCALNIELGPSLMEWVGVRYTASRCIFLSSIFFSDTFFSFHVIIIISIAWLLLIKQTVDYGYGLSSRVHHQHRPSPVSLCQIGPTNQTSISIPFSHSLCYTQSSATHLQTRIRDVRRDAWRHDREKENYKLTMERQQKPTRLKTKWKNLTFCIESIYYLLVIHSQTKHVLIFFSSVRPPTQQRGRRVFARVNSSWWQH